MNKKKIVIFLIAAFLIYIGLFFYTHLSREKAPARRITTLASKAVLANLEFSAVYDYSYKEVVRGYNVYAICKLDSFKYKGINVIHSTYGDKFLSSLYSIPGGYRFNDSIIAIWFNRSIVLKKNAHIYTFLGDSTIHYESINGW